jgi:uncharacterized membrane protein (UPF0136 family)
VSIRTILQAGLLLAAAFALVSELATRDGVGALEYVVGIALVVGLVFFALRLTLRARRSRPA